MTLKFVPVLIALCLPACATHSARDDSPSSDLQALVQTVERQLPNRTLPTGRQYCAELASTEGEQDECMGELEALNLLRVRDRERALQQLHSGANRIEATRLQCRWWQFGCRADKRALQDGRKPP